MIVVYQTTITGWTHVPVNISLLAALVDRYPTETVHVFADGDHLADVRADAGSRFDAVDVRMQAIRTPGFGAHPAARIRHDGLGLMKAVRSVDDDAPCLLVLPYITGELVRTVQLIQALRSARTGALFICHGNLNEAFGWRSRNPVYRWCDLRSGLAAANPSRIAMVVLEDCIRRDLEARLPALTGTIEVVDHPLIADQAEMFAGAPSLEAPCQFGLLGVGTLAKGIDLFARIARSVSLDHPDRAEFHLLGKLHPEAASIDFLHVSGGRRVHLERADYLDRLGRLHYAVYPYRQKYYALSASGTLIDALVARKPLIATDLPIFRDLFDRFGDIGHLCKDEEDLAETVHHLVRTPDPDRYRRQCLALERVAQDRLPRATAERLGAIIERRFPDLLRPDSSRPGGRFTQAQRA